MKVSAVDQAHYLARAFHKASCEWPWMGPMPLRAYLTLKNAATRGPADLWVETESVGPVQPGQNLEYVIRYTNIGGQTAAAVAMTDTLPAGTAESIHNKSHSE